MTNQLDNNINTPVEDLLQQWVYYTDQLHTGARNTENIQAKLQVRKMLDNRGVENLEIYHMDTESYTLRYNHKGNKIKKNIPILK